MTPDPHQSRHRPVMLQEVLEAIAPQPGDLILDGTFGGGGYSTAFLNAAACQVLALDRDEDAIARGAALQARFQGRLFLAHGQFSTMESLMHAHGFEAADGVALDIGVSSDQIDRAERGFSFAQDGPLDMRMGRHGPSAADAVNTLSEAEIANILWAFGEERRARALAKAIVAERREAPINSTLALAALCARVLGQRGDAIHPATRTFQALRIYVNDELGELAQGLSAAERVLRPNGRLAVVSFHSLEDRLVKRFLTRRSTLAARPSRHLPIQAAGPEPSFRLQKRQAEKPSVAEVAANPRARSARLRSAIRTGAPALALDPRYDSFRPE